MNGNRDETETRCAVRLPGRPFGQGPLDVYLRANGITDARRFAAKDDDELNDAVCDGNIRRVVFSGMEDLLEAIWIGHVRHSRWLELGVRVDVVRDPSGDWRQWVALAAGGFEGFERRRRRRQTIAATVLSLLALGGVATLLWLG